MQRRSFIKSLLLGAVAPMFLPGAGRIWKPERRPRIMWKELNYESFEFSAGQILIKHELGKELVDVRILNPFTGALEKATTVPMSENMVKVLYPLPCAAAGFIVGPQGFSIPENIFGFGDEV